MRTMNCEICGKSGCTRFLHSRDEQERFLRETQSDAAAVSLLRLLPLAELAAAYRLAKAKDDPTDVDQHATRLIGRELVRRTAGTDKAGAQ